MGRGRVGGTRSKISGKVGNEVYKIVYNPQGKLAQIVQAAESSRINNNTEGQARARLAMGMIERAMCALQPVITWSFEGYDRGQASANEFSRLNVPYIQADMQSHWNANSIYDYYKKGVQLDCAGAYLVSNGSLRYSWAGLSQFSLSAVGSFDLYTWDGVPDSTFKTWSLYNNIQAGDTITFIGFLQPFLHEGSKLLILSMSVPSWWTDDMAVSQDTFGNLFKFSGNITPDVSWDSDNSRVHIHWQDPKNKRYTMMSHVGFIKSRWQGNKILCSRCRLSFQYPQFQNSWNNYKPSQVWSTWYQDKTL